jgi:hypothetical protein
MESGTWQVYPLLETLALVEGTPRPDVADLLAALQTTLLPPGPVLLVTPRASGLEGALAGRLRRPVVTLDVSRPLVHELFEWGDAVPAGDIGKLRTEPPGERA